MKEYRRNVLIYMLCYHFQKKKKALILAYQFQIGCLIKELRHGQSVFRGGMGN